MPKLSNVTLKAMALTGNPANRRPIHAIKSASKETFMEHGNAATPGAEGLAEPTADVLKALQSIELSTAAHDDEHRAAAEAIGRLLAAHPGLSHDDVLKVAKAAGVSTTKAADKAKDVDDEVDEEMDEETDEEPTKKAPNKKGNPFADKMEKSAPKADDSAFDAIIKSAASVEVQKAVSAMREAYEARLAKSEAIIAEERDHRLGNLIKSEVQTSFKNLGTDHDKLASILKHARETGKGTHAKDLLAVLKAADAQIGLAQKSGGSAFQSVGKSTQFGTGGGSAMGQINALVDAMVQKGEVKKSRPQLVDDVLMTPQGQALWAQHCEERGF